LEKEEKDISLDATPSAVEKEEDVVAELEDVESLKKVLAEERAKAGDYLANWQRAQADFINYKRRVEQERNEVARFANATLVLSLLPVLDDLERALENVPAELAGINWVEGIELIYRKLQALVQECGLCEIVAVGQPFDPNIHEAVLRCEGEEGMVVEEVQKGYRLYERVLRPTKVMVGGGNGGKKQTEEADETDNGEQ